MRSLALLYHSRPFHCSIQLMRTIKEEKVDLSDYLHYADAVRQVGRFLDEVYMHRRIHSSLGYRTPAEFESQWRISKPSRPTFTEYRGNLCPT